MYLPWNASKARVREAENARKNRLEIIKALSQGQVTRRDLFKMGLVTAAGTLAFKNGLHPLAPSAYASIPTGAARSPLGPVNVAFTQPMPRFDVLPREQFSTHSWRYGLPPAQEFSNQTPQPLDPALVASYPSTGNFGPIEGRPPGSDWAHQRWAEFPPQVAVEVTQEGAKVNTAYNAGVPSSLNSGILSLSDPGVTSTSILPTFWRDPASGRQFPNQDPLKLWTFNGTIPPKLLLGRYGETIIFRHHNRLPADITKNGGFGRHSITTHNHNGHNGAESDGFANAFFFPGQFYDYRWPIILAGHDSINPGATDSKTGSPADNGGINRIPGDWHETMSTHWFHDHMFGFTAQNVYKGNAAMFNLYSAIDRGAEDIQDGVNLQLPSGIAKSTGKSWGNLDYDVNLMLADKAWDGGGQLFYDIGTDVNFDGFLGDVVTVNLAYKPYFEVEARKYRFRILVAAVSRFFKVALCDASGNAVPFQQIANDGNLLPAPLTLTELDEQGIAERYDIVVDFSHFKAGSKLWMVNLCEHENGKLPSADLTLAQALSGQSSDPGVGKFLELRVVRKPAQKDQSQVPKVMIPNPPLPVPTAFRTFEFAHGGASNGVLPWVIKTNGLALDADMNQISASPPQGSSEVWTLQGGGGWDHPVHIHFEEGQILSRNGSAANVPAWEKGRKDVYRLHPGGSVTIQLKFRDFFGTYMEHCHNTMHEDNAMLLRWDIDRGGPVYLPTPNPTPQGVTFTAPDVVGL
jgi:manganese oxidase